MKKLIQLYFLFFSSLLLSQTKSDFSINGELFELPGKKWEVQGLLKESGQYHIVNKKQKISLLISVRNAKNFEFYNDTLSLNQLVEKFYFWEKDYWMADNGIKANVDLIKMDSNRNFIIWSLLAKNVPQNNNQDLLSYNLYTIRNGKLVGINFRETKEKDMMSKEEIIIFLESLL